MKKQVFKYKVVYESTKGTLQITYKDAYNIADMYDQMLNVFDFVRVIKYERAHVNE